MPNKLSGVIVRYRYPMNEKELDMSDMPLPYWAFAWAGGQGLARYILDHPDCVRNKVVLDFAAGSGLVAIAAAIAGAKRVIANDIDPFSMTATSMNAALNDVSVDLIGDDLVGQPEPVVDTIAAGDICYEEPLAQEVEAWLRQHVRRGSDVLIGDPGRAYLPTAGMVPLNRYSVELTQPLEDHDVRRAKVYRMIEVA